MIDLFHFAASTRLRSNNNNGQIVTAKPKKAETKALSKNSIRQPLHLFGGISQWRARYLYNAR